MKCRLFLNRRLTNTLHSAVSTQLLSLRCCIFKRNQIDGSTKFGVISLCSHLYSWHVPFSIVDSFCYIRVLYEYSKQRTLSSEGALYFIHSNTFIQYIHINMGSHRMVNRIQSHWTTKNEHRINFDVRHNMHSFQTSQMNGRNMCAHLALPMFFQKLYGFFYAAAVEIRI